MPVTSSQTAAARHVRVTLAHVDRLLTKALHRIGIATPGAFSPEYDDLTADEVFVLNEAVEEVRTALVRLLDTLALDKDPPTVPARWGVQTDWHFAEVALAELAGSSLRAWGGADPELEHLLRDEAERLRTRLAQARSLLAGGRPDSRATPESLAPGAELAPLRALFACRELTPLHGALRAAVERLRDPDLVVGVFGRVSTGKSSLVNAVLGEAVLPVAAIPMTRRIVRLRHGPRALHLRAGDGTALGTKAWEERTEWLGGNPDAVYGCELHCPRVPRGTCWLDTPGLGATHPALGAAAARAVWQCDIVVLCLGAGALPGLDERAIIARARSQAIPVHLVITQADRLRGEELQALQQWLEANFSDATQSIVAAATRGDPGHGQIDAVLAPALRSPASTRQAGLQLRMQTLFATARSLVAASDAHDSPLAKALDAAESALAGMIEDAPRQAGQPTGGPPRAI